MGDVEDVRKTFVVPAIGSFDHYDFGRAKICCSLAWLAAKAFGTDSTPEDLKHPFYTDQYDQEHIKPPVVELLLSAELYCRAGSLILKSDVAKPLLGHEAVIRALAHKGLYVTDQERLVTERDLSKKPIQMSAHLAMIDALMMAYTVEVVSVEKVVACMQQYSMFYQDREVPYDTEDAVACWINKVNEYLKDIISSEQKMKDVKSTESSDSQHSPTKWYWKLVPARYRKDQNLPRHVPWIPPVDNLLKDSTDGCALVALIHFYCPDLVQLDDICLKESMSLADSLYNLQLIQDFCQENLSRCCHFSLEDMLYASSSIKNNYLVFMAELFWWFEVVKPNFVKPRVLEKEGQDATPKLKNMPSVPISNVTKRSFLDRPSTSGQSSLPLRPQSQSSGVIKRSTSMSYVDGYIGTWPKEKRSSTQGISFDIPFDKENSVHTASPTTRGLSRSVSTDGLGFKVNHVPRNMRRNLSFQPVNGLRTKEGIEEEDVPPGTAQCKNLPGVFNGPSLDSGTPSIEEALEIIHYQANPQNGQQGDNGFFLHGQGHQDDELDCKGATSSDTTEVDTGIHVCTEDIQETLDEDSSLKDLTVSIDMDTDLESHRDDTSPCPSLLGARSPAGVKMTSFAEQKLRKRNHQEARNCGGGSSGSQKTTPELSPVRQLPPSSPPPPLEDPAQAIASEMVQLRMKLEEKRRAIEAQKKKVEAAFTRHRQRMGRTAFLTVVKKKEDDTVSPMLEEATKIGESGANIILQPSQMVDDANLRPFRRHLETPEGPPPARSPCEEGAVEADLMEYTKSIEKLNTSLAHLQTEMQRLAQQQEVIMQMREQQSWNISPQKQVRDLRTAATRSSGSPSPAESPHPTRRSPTSIRRKSASFHSKTPRAQRPGDLKVAPLSRVLSAPQSVDSLPRLRRFSPSQPQISCLTYGTESSSTVELSPFLATKTPTLDNELPGKEEELKEQSRSKKAEPKERLDPKPIQSTVSEVLSQPVTETFIVTSSQVPDASSSGRSLIEVPLSVLKPLDGHMPEERGEAEGDGGMEVSEDDQKMCCGFFFKDDMKGEGDMAVRRAALLEKRLRREREMQQKKQEQEVEMEQKKEEARLKAEEERQKKEEEKARREFIKQEYLRRKQLKLMDDMDTVIKPRPHGAKQKKPRPKSIHRDVVESPKGNARPMEGSRPRVFSVSSLSLASLNMGDNDSIHSEKRATRADSADGFLSPCRSGSRNGERDWENGSTTSSVASNTEYTGPKLYKEPSAKSNKYIIQNALSHCCLAGRVNEGQKNKILEEMEKSEANNFLILFRDSGCQFRSLYTYCPELEEITKLAGIGPKNITLKMIEGLYKYNSDRKQFSHIPAKTMSASVDAITIHSHLWQTKKPGTPKKVLPNKS